MKILFLIPALLLLIMPLTYTQDLQKAKQMFEQKKYSSAKKELEKVLDKGDNAEAYFYLGRTLMAMKEYDDASDAFEEAVEMNEKNADYHFWLGRAYGEEALNSSFITQGILAPKIKEEFITAVKLDKNHIPARQALIQFYLKAPGMAGGSIEKAIEHSKILIKLDEKKGLAKLVEIYLNEENYKEVDSYLKQLESKYPTDTTYYNVYNIYGYALLEKGKVNEAIEKFQKQVLLAPGMANPHDSLGDAYLAAGRKNEAKEEFKKALAIDPNFAASKKKLNDLNSGK